MDCQQKQQLNWHFNSKNENPFITDQSKNGFYGNNSGFVDSGFVTTCDELVIGLDPQVQQDAAEFSKLFISLLESSLSCQIVDEVKSIVQNQFRGEYAYVTKCCKCQRESKRPSQFYELELPLQGKWLDLNCWKRMNSL